MKTDRKDRDDAQLRAWIAREARGPLTERDRQELRDLLRHT